MLTPEISQTHRQGRSIFSAAPWLARCYPSDQIPRIPHGFYEAAHGIFFVDLNHEHQPILDTITGNVAKLTTRPPRKRLIAVFGALLGVSEEVSAKGERKVLRNLESNPRTLG